MLPRVLQPGGQVVERVPPRDVVDEEGARRAPVVRPRDGPKGLLAGRVPYLKLDLFAVNVDHARAKLHPDGQVVHRLEPLVRKLKQKT